MRCETVGEAVGEMVGGRERGWRMSEMVDVLRELAHTVTTGLASAGGAEAVRHASDADVCEMLSIAAGIVRLAEGVIVEATAQVVDRSRTPAVADRLTTTAGCRSVRELLQRCTRASGRTVRSYELAAAAVHRESSISSGELLPAPYPRLRDALGQGVIGVDGLEAALAPLRSIGPRLSTEARLLADADLAAHARGEEVAEPADDHSQDGAESSTDALSDELPPRDPSAPLACSADDVRARAQLLAVVLDPDGAEPQEVRGMRRRALTLGREHDGVVRVQGHLLPEAAAQLQTLLDAYLNPKVDGVLFRPTSGDEPDPSHDGPSQADLAHADERTRPQRMHDAFAGILAVAARHDEMPRLGGAAPTLVVSATVDELRARRGWAHLHGGEAPVSLAVARHVACEGRLLRVLQNDEGRVLSLKVSDRVFNAHQRRAILLRDGGCVIPGCRVPAAWCELHHVEEHARGGATEVDNGVALCWFHHRSLGVSGWEVRMSRGVPEVRAPQYWDATGHWRRPRPPSAARHPREERPPPTGESDPA